MKRLTIGVLAHVDSGKTTLSEAMLYKTGELKTLGRVDHKDSFLDGNQMERNRGITIFSKQAILEWKNNYGTLLDTPGHVDFSAEMERTLGVLDYAILVISGSDGVQSHTETLWKLLKHYKVPALIFVNKMDLAVHSRPQIMESLKGSLDKRCIDFTKPEGEAFEDELSMCSESMMEMILEGVRPSDCDIAEAVSLGQIYPCYFGSALRLEGIDELLEGLDRFTIEPVHKEDFGARVFKIARDESYNRLTFVKVTGGCISVRDGIGGEKVNSIRIYSGMKYVTADTAESGMVCALTGLSTTLPGDGLGSEPSSSEEILEPVMTYSVILPEEKSAGQALRELKEMAEEDPKLHISWNEATEEINIKIMGQVQLEILTTMVRDRFGYEVGFDKGRIVYKETITDIVEGVGHFEPLRHYAEVHLILEPGERGSGLTFTSSCSEDTLDRNWQRLILSHLAEKEHLGVLTGSPVTDMKITLASGRASKKHTEGGDFRQATYRAVRNGLMKADSVVLEPWDDFELKVPADNIGRAMADIQRMHGTFGEPQSEDGMTILKGKAPVSELKDYQSQINSYTKGRGRIATTLWGYDKCHDEEAVIAAAAYEAEHDINNSADSVFCDHGTGDIVKWDQVEDFMNLPSVLKDEEPFDNEEFVAERARTYGKIMATDKELMDIFERTYGPIKQNPLTAPGAKYRVVAHKPKTAEAEKPKQRKSAPIEMGPTYVLIDGYNLIHAWDELEELARTDFAIARERLIDILCNYQGFTEYTVIVVFDAYKVKGGIGSSEKVRNINVVYTKEAETADMYIERVTHDIAKKHRVRVVTSDGLEQLIIMGHGALRTSSREFVEEIVHIESAIMDAIR